MPNYLRNRVVRECVCQQCGHRWTPRGTDLPKRCPNQSCPNGRKWREPRKRGAK